MSSQMLQAVQALFHELNFCSSLLIGKKVFVPLLDRQMDSYFPLPDEIVQELIDQGQLTPMMKQDPVKALEIIEKDSPLLLNRDLASVALVRVGAWTEKRADRLCGLMEAGEANNMLEEEAPDSKPYLSLEAAMALCHWNNQERPLSRWWNWKLFLDLLDLGLVTPPYEPWAAQGYLWAHQQQGGELSDSDPTYKELVISLGPLLENLPT